jgi:hypothetical protein
MKPTMRSAILLLFGLAVFLSATPVLKKNHTSAPSSVVAQQKDDCEKAHPWQNDCFLSVARCRLALF